MSKQSAEKIITDEMLLLNAIKKNDVDKCREILKSNSVNLNKELTTSDTIIYTTPLTYAARFGNIQIIKMLLKAGADPNYGIVNESRARPLYAAVQQRRDNDVVKVLIEAGADVNYNQHFFSPTTVLHLAVRDYRTELIKILLDAGTNPNKLSDSAHSSGKSPLQVILSGPQKSAPRENLPGAPMEIAKLLIEAGADVNMLSKSGMTPIHIAEKKQKFLKLLIENGADPSIPNKRGRAPIDTPKVRQIYTEVILSKVKLLRAQQRLAFATMMLDSNHDDKSNDFFMNIAKFLEVTPLTQKTLEKTNELLNRALQDRLKKEFKEEIRGTVYKSLREAFKGEPINDMVEFYSKQLKNPNLSPEHRKELRRKKRTRKNREGIPLGSSDESSSRKSRSSPSEELRQAVSLSLKALSSDKSSSRKSRSVKSSSSFDAQLQLLKNIGLSDKEIIDIASEGAKKKSKKSKKYKKSKKKSK